MYNPKTVILSGGVSANQYLRDYLSKAVLEKSGIDVLIPPRELSTDNALGIAIAGAIKFTQGARSRTLLDGKPNWKIDEI
jgi:N6-L-threonylcarbamoyladenine synthase